MLNKTYYMGRNLETLNTQQVKKVIVTVMDLWRKFARKPRKENFLNETIRNAVNAGRSILEVIEEKLLRHFEHINRMTGNILPGEF
jgi:dissimilatory sulfite reductase (desulfoviridin) alpha/beta subunit